MEIGEAAEMLEREIRVRLTMSGTNEHVAITPGSIGRSVEMRTSGTASERDRMPPSREGSFTPAPAVYVPEVTGDQDRVIWRNVAATQTANAASTTSTVSPEALVVPNSTTIANNTAQAIINANTTRNRLGYIRHRLAPGPPSSLSHFSSQIGIPSLLHPPSTNGTSANTFHNYRDAARMSVRSQFRTKVVCDLRCRDCLTLVCSRGMRAILLADTNVELFSTDCPPMGMDHENAEQNLKN
ncbi:Protein fam72a [Phlyctochytrium bullatum]|nr:Protein fam72a [Phlyctochytrium bullatum]